MSSSSIAMARLQASPTWSARALTQLVRKPKSALALAFLPLLGLSSLASGWTTLAPHVAAALFGAVAAELLVVSVGQGKLRWPGSALLSGLIVAFVLAPETPRAATLAIGTIATASKYVIRTRRGHFFNPAALALLVAIPLFGAGQSWWGGLPDLAWPWLLVLLAGGAFVVDRIDRFPLVLSFVGTYFGLLTAVALASPGPVGALFRPPFLQAALFLALFMLTDPPTAPGRFREQVLIGSLAAIVAVVAELLGAGQAFLLLGLLAGNLALAYRRLTARSGV